MKNSSVLCRKAMICLYHSKKALLILSGLISFFVTSAQVSVTGIVLSPATLNLIAGGANGTLTATVAPSDATDKTVTWTSSDTNVAKLVNGLVTPVAAGKDTIIVTTVDGSFKDTCVVTVAAKINVTGVSISPKTSYMYVGGPTATLTARISPSNATVKTVIWSSDDTTIAKVKNGVVTPVSAGTDSIRVTTVDGSLKAVCAVIVNASFVHAESVSSSLMQLTFAVGDAATRLTATVFPVNANNKAVTWATTDTNIAKVSTNGNVTPVKLGTAKIIVTTADSSRTDTCLVRVIIKETGISLNKDTLYMTVGQSSDAIIATVTPDSATDKEVSWMTYSSSVATVSNGIVKAVSPGETLITAFTKNVGKSAACVVFVSDSVNALPEQGPPFTVFPNPASDEITIQGMDEAGSVEVYNISGTLVFQQKNSVKVNVSSWPEGVYIIRVKNKNTISKTKFAVKK